MIRTDYEIGSLTRMFPLLAIIIYLHIYQQFNLKSGSRKANRVGVIKTSKICKQMKEELSMEDLNWSRSSYLRVI